MKLFYNETTKVVFGSDAEQSEGIREITRDEIPDLIANGATVDASANDLGKSDLSAGAMSDGTQTGSTLNQDAPAALVPGAPATNLATDANAGDVTGIVAVPPVTPAGTPVVPSQPTAVTSEGHEDAELIGDKPAGDYAGCEDHSSLLGRLLADLEGAVHMGKSEIIALVDAARNVFKG